MIDISVHKLNKYYGANHVLKDVSFEIYSGEKVGLLGRNGSGKSTIFRIIGEGEDYESGSIAKANGKTIEMLAQIPTFNEGDTVDDILRSSYEEINEVHTAMKKIEGDEDPKVLDRYIKLMEEYERLGGYEIEFKIDKICNGMHIDGTMRGSLFSVLSGGEKTRVNLARILLRDCDILLLDEPSNHLDLASMTWLEKFLRDFNGTVLIISHDRVFLDNVVTRIIDIEDGEANFYGGNFSWYAVEKQRRFEALLEQYERQQKEIKRIEERAKWFVANNRFTTKHHAILSRLDHIEKIDRPSGTKKVTEEFNSGGYAAKEAIVLENVGKAFDGKQLFSNINLTVNRNDRIALVGENGSGKTTLLKMILGEEPCTEGTIKVSSNIKVAYLSQVVLFDDENWTMLETFRQGTGLDEPRARAALANFNFAAEDIAKKISALSGGERSRLKVALLMQDKVNFLIMDEPTNHLDIDSREWIESAVEEWDCTLLFISHDRFFLNKFASKIWSLEGGKMEVFVGGFEAFLAQGRE